MTNSVPPARQSPPLPARSRGVRRLLRRILAGLLLGALVLGAAWGWRWANANVPRPVLRGVTGWFLTALEIGHVVAWGIAVVGVLALGVWLLRRARRGRAVGRPPRLAVLGPSLVVALLVAEGAAWVWHGALHRLPDLPTRFARPRDPNAIVLAVIGESSATGIPYDPWVSVAEIVAWKLRPVFPEREVRVRMLAHGGMCLEQAVTFLTELDEPPDAILVYAGHNEFQARFGWAREVRHYRDEQAAPARSALERAWMRLSPVARLVAEIQDRQVLDVPPPEHATRQLVDRPAYRPDEFAYLRDDFARRLDGVTAYARRVGALPILIAPAGNEADFPPSRSSLAPETTPAERARFADLFRGAAALEARDPDAALGAFEALAERHPEFAEGHFRLARLYAKQGDHARAEAHRVQARDLDGMPMRCPGPFLAAFPEAARRHDALLIDGRDVLRALSPDRALDDQVFHDAQHPNLAGYTALAQAVLDGLAARRAFGWPAGVPAPRVEPAEVARHFGMDPERWAEVCDKTALFYGRIAYIRHDPTPLVVRGSRFRAAARAIRAGAAPESVGLPGIGIGDAPSGAAAISPAACTVAGPPR
jgi:lysophospholipase L1-like esterase